MKKALLFLCVAYFLVFVGPVEARGHRSGSQSYRPTYPNNLAYTMQHTEALIASGKYEEAIPKIEILRKNADRTYQLAADVFEGVIMEKYKKNDKLAAGFYWASFKFQHDEHYTKNYHAMAYAGIARIYNRQNDKIKAKEFYKKCLDIADYKGIKEEAEAFK